jgi:hypothetical protein
MYIHLMYKHNICFVFEVPVFLIRSQSDGFKMKNENLLGEAI